jgi:hypothetical protein
LLNREALTWLNQFAGHPLNDNQRLVLVYLREYEQMTNSDNRRLSILVDTGLATRELRDLAEHGLIELHASWRWAYNTLTPEARRQVHRQSKVVQVLAFTRQHGSITRQQCQPCSGFRAGRPRTCCRACARPGCCG